MPRKALLPLLSLGILVAHLPAADVPRILKSGAQEGRDTASHTFPARAQSPSGAKGATSATQRVSSQLPNPSSLPLTFIENRGQFDERVRFQLKTHKQTVWVTNTGITFDTLRVRPEKSGVSGAKGTEPAKASRLPRGLIDPAKAETPSFDRLVFSEDFAGTECCSKVQGMRAQPGLYNYFFGNDPAKWQTKVPAFSGVLLQDVWLGIDLRLYSNGPDLEQEFIVQRGEPGSCTGRVSGHRWAERSQRWLLSNRYCLRQTARNTTTGLSASLRPTGCGGRSFQTDE